QSMVCLSLISLFKLTASVSLVWFEGIALSCSHLFLLPSFSSSYPPTLCHTVPSLFSSLVPQSSPSLYFSLSHTHTHTLPLCPPALPPSPLPSSSTLPPSLFLSLKHTHTHSPSPPLALSLSPPSLSL